MQSSVLVSILHALLLISTGGSGIYACPMSQTDTTNSRGRISPQKRATLKESQGKVCRLSEQNRFNRVLRRILVLSPLGGALSR